MGESASGAAALIVVGIVTLFLISVVIFNAGGSITDDGLSESITVSADLAAVELRRGRDDPPLRVRGAATQREDRMRHSARG